MRPFHPGNQKGFSLLELLVAFAIMSISIGLLYRVAGGNAKSVVDIQQHQQATWLAESILNTQSALTAQGWNEEGESSGFKWQVISTPFNSGLQGPQVVPLHEVKITVQWAASTRASQLSVVTLFPEVKPPAGSVVK